MGRQGTRCGFAWAQVALAVAVALGAPAVAEEPVEPDKPSRNLYGMTGLIDMPTAEMQPDGEISFTTSYFAGYHRNTATVQILPAVEAAFRYSVLDDLAGFGENLYDRSFDIKLRLMHEGPIWPSVSIGLQDFLGTGVYSGEYLVATKSLLDGDIKVTGGVGWGRLGGVDTLDNPFCRLVDRLCVRDQLTTNTGGTVDIDTYFSGERVGLFGGIEWRTPLDGLTFKAEVSSDAYDQEERSSSFEQDTLVNFGLEYRVNDAVDVGAYYMYGSEIGVRLSLTGNPFRPPVPADNEPPPLPVMPRPEPDEDAVTRLFGRVREMLGGEPTTVAFAETGVTEVEVSESDGGARWATATMPPSADYVCPDEAARAIDAEHGMLDAVSFRHPDGTLVCTVTLRPAGRELVRETVRAATAYPTGWYEDAERRQELVEALVEALDPERIGLFGIELEPTRVAVYIENKRYREMPRAIGRTARALTTVMPPSVALFEIVPVEGSLPTASVAIERAALEDQIGRPDAVWDSWVSARVTDAEQPDWSAVEGTLDQFPRFSWSINPATPLHLFDPDQPVRADLSVDVGASVEVLPGLSFTGSIRKRVVGQLDEIERESDSVLPKVRSDIGKYLKQGDPGLSRLTMDYVTKLDDALYGRLSAGYFEPMFGGVGGEVLWKPADQDWGIGADLNWVKQRDFDQRFGFRDYDVVTGHASVYWDTGYYGLAVQVDGGRYLAGDWGGTFTLRRRFSNGWEIGGFFTLTDVPFDEFGEGSFDKGIFINIPLNYFLPIETRGTYATLIRPLTRDGGQRVRAPSPLYPLVADMDRGGLRTNWRGFWE